MGGKGSLYSNWLKNFSITVFEQTFHAFMLVFILEMIFELDSKLMELTKTSNNGLDIDKAYGIIAIVTICAVTGLVSMEKFIKSLFGIENGLMGDTKSSGMKAFMAVKSVGNMGASLAKPIGEIKDSKRRLKNIKSKIFSL